MENNMSLLSTFITSLLGMFTANVITHYFFGW